MPAQTVMQVRRDTAANWSSTNPVLANGEMGYDTTNKLFKVGDGSTAWNSLKVMAQHNTGSAARPLLTDGAYLSGSGLVLSGLSSNYASTPDSAALSITGDIDIKVKVALTDWTPAAQQTLITKYGAAGQRSYFFNVETNGTLRLITSADGTNIIQSFSTVATGVTDGATKWVRATLDVNDGAGNNRVKFYTSDNGTTWTQLGTTITNAGTTSIFDSTAQLEIGSFVTNTQMLIGTVYDVVIQSAYDTTDNTTSLQFDANFETATADALAFTESSGNAATVTINTTRYSYGVPNAGLRTVDTQTQTANTDWYYLFRITAPTIVDMWGIEVTSGPASSSVAYFAIYNADNDLQPTGSPIVTDSQTVGTSATGIFRKQITPVTLQAGNYILALNPSVNFTVRRFLGTDAVTFSWGANGLNQAFYTSRTAATFTSSPRPWNSIFASSVVVANVVLLRWKAA